MRADSSRSRGGAGTARGWFCDVFNALPQDANHRANAVGLQVVGGAARKRDAPGFGMSPSKLPRTSFSA
jgi:hypothetical protein